MTEARLGGLKQIQGLLAGPQGLTSGQLCPLTSRRRRRLPRPAR